MPAQYEHRLANEHFLPHRARRQVWTLHWCSWCKTNVLTLVLTSDQVCHIERHLINLQAAMEQYEGLAAYKAKKRGHMSSAAPCRHSMSTHLRAVELLNIPQDADVIALHEVDCHTLQQTSALIQPQACMLSPIKCSQCFARTHGGYGHHAEARQQQAYWMCVY